jgi:hypothetical protein
MERGWAMRWQSRLDSILSRRRSLESFERRLTLIDGAEECGSDLQPHEVERLARRTRVAEVGGQLLTAAFTFLGEIIA